jgi:hypothetical protein
MIDSQLSYVHSVVKRFPGLLTVLDEHISDNFGEVLPHLFFGDVTRYSLELLSKSEAGDLASLRELHQLLEYLEQSFSSDDSEVWQLIAASYIENLPNKREAGFRIRTMLGPNMQQQLRRYSGDV